MFEVDREGWVVPARRLPSSNFNARPDGAEVDLLVIHNISLPAEQFGGPYIEALFTNCLDCTAHSSFGDLQGLEVSAHFLINRNGALTQFVSCLDRAWHAGASCHAGRENCNDFSIGIELEGADTIPFTDAQYRQLAALSRALMCRFPALTSERIVGHSDIAPGRKTDPGPAFDWSRYLTLLETP